MNIREEIDVDATFPGAQEPKPPIEQVTITPVDPAQPVKVAFRSASGAPQPSLPARTDGALIGTSFEEQWRLAKVFHASRLIPKAFSTPEQVFTALQYAIQLGLQPLVALRQIYVVNNIPHIWGDLPLALVMKTGQCERLREIVFDKDGKEISRVNSNLKAEVYGAECILKRSGFEEVTSVFTMEDAKRANLTGKDLYKLYPGRMLKYRARSQAIKDLFPDCLAGIGVSEYDLHEAPDMKEVRSEVEPALQAVNERFGKTD